MKKNRVGVLDTDGYFNHPFFYDKDISIIGKKDISAQSGTDSFTHAELVCSIIFKENPDCSIILNPIVGSNLKCSVKSLLGGIQTLINKRVDIINLSLGIEDNYYPELEYVCNKAKEAGIYIVSAYSNNGKITFPASFESTIGVNGLLFDNSGHYLWKRNQDICASHRYVSIYHLEVPKLVFGNSYVCAKISGIVSSFLMKGELSENIWLKTNRKFDYTILKKYRCWILSDRKEEKMQKQFIGEVTNAIHVDELAYILDNEYRDFLLDADYDILFIDCVHYKYLMDYKKIIINMAVSLQEREKEIVLRYPLLGLYESACCCKDRKVIINQMYY